MTTLREVNGIDPLLCKHSSPIGLVSSKWHSKWEWCHHCHWQSLHGHCTA